MLRRLSRIWSSLINHARLYLRFLIFCCSFYSSSIANCAAQSVTNEYIITYHRKFPLDDRILRLSSLLKHTYLNYSVDPRPALQHLGLSSDFDVVTFHNLTGTHADSFVSTVQKMPGIKGVYPQLRFQRKILGDAGQFDARLPKLFHRSGTPDLPGTIPLHFSKQPWRLLRTSELWRRGICGAGVRVGIFDTGLVSTDSHPHFKSARVKDRSDWTVDETRTSDALDGHGHGTFVAGLIAATASESSRVDAILSAFTDRSHCPPAGMAPFADLYIFRVFTDSQISYTSWFLDAFNYAISLKLHVINLSVGGPDFMDQPFVDKVLELSSNGILLVSAIGNDGPLFGTLNNPADQMDVLGVGGIDATGRIARFSSRGMTTWSLPFGYGQAKPDIVSFSTGVISSDLTGSCRTLSGTSVASPVVTGIVALLIDAVLKRNAHLTATRLPNSGPFPLVPLNPASIKQALISGATRLSHVHVFGTADPPLWPISSESSNIFEQGAGLVNLNFSFQIIQRLMPQASLFPSVLDLTQCPYMWPYCAQPFYYSMRPIVVNVTILNSMDVVGYIMNPPVYHPFADRNGQRLRVSFTYSSRLWPWTGHLAIHFEVQDDPVDSVPSALFYGTAEGFVSLTVQSRDKLTRKVLETHLELPIRARIIRTPSRKYRILFDQFHSLRYPPEYIPRDDLTRTNEPLDWLGDHVHTNMRDMFMNLIRVGYYVEVLNEPFTCFNASNYGTLLLVDPEEEFFPEEVHKLFLDVTESQLSLLVFAEWYNTSVMHNLRFFDTNTRRMWIPETGGANLPALNELLHPFGARLGDTVYAGELSLEHRTIRYTSGSSLQQFPCGNISSVSGRGVLLRHRLVDLGEQVIRHPPQSASKLHPSIENRKSDVEPWRLVASDNDPEPAVLGLWTPDTSPSPSGRLIVYGDSDCLSSTHLSTDCFWLLRALLQFVTSAYGRIPHLIAERIVPSPCSRLDPRSEIPLRPARSTLYRVSNVIKNNCSFEPLPNGSLPREAYRSLRSCLAVPQATVEPVTEYPTNGISYAPRPLLLYPKLELPPVALNSVCHTEHIGMPNSLRSPATYSTSIVIVHILVFYTTFMAIVYILYRCYVPSAQNPMKIIYLGCVSLYVFAFTSIRRRRNNRRRTPPSRGLSF